MSVQHPEPSSDRTGTLMLAAFGALAVAALMGAMVLVVKGQMQQSQELKAQWQNLPGAGQAKASAPVKNAATAQAGALGRPETGNGVVPASFDRP